MAEFACAPELSPTSMYLTVPRGKDVSIVCRVISDPQSEVAWFFKGARINATVESRPEEEGGDGRQVGLGPNSIRKFYHGF